jgi:hypothetical protein
MRLEPGFVLRVEPLAVLLVIFREPELVALRGFAGWKSLSNAYLYVERQASSTTRILSCKMPAPYNSRSDSCQIEGFAEGW